VTIINESTERLLRLVNRILDVATSRRPADDRAPPRAARDGDGPRAPRACPHADAAGVWIDRIGAAPIRRCWRRGGLVEVVELLSNAIKASPGGGTAVGIERDAS
jgi:hypothetical protein